MTSASVIFYGRRYRPLRSFDELGFGSASSSTSSSSSDPSSSSSSNGHHHRRRRGDLHRRHRHNHNLDDASKSRPSLVLQHPSTRSPVRVSELHQEGGLGESTSRNNINGEATRGMSRRHSGNERLPGTVLLAKERLVRRLRGVSVSGVRQQSRETTARVHRNDFRLVDANMETSSAREQSAVNTIVSELPPGAHQHSAAQEPNKKPLGLTKETLSALHHEVFLEPQKDTSNSMSKASKECSICLENFVEGNELISLHCGHRFHTECLYPWLQTCGDCPYCRSCIVIT